MNIIITAIIIGGSIGLLIAIVLSYFAKKFAVKTNPLIQKVNSVLPQINCGSCGYPNCEAYAKAVVAGEDPSKCVPGGQEVTDVLSNMMGKKSREIETKKARVLCNGGIVCKDSFEYDGIKTCKAATIVNNGQKACVYGCMGLGDCIKVCPFNAIIINEQNIAEVIDEKCTGCGECVKACPKKIIELVPEKKRTWVRCKSDDPGAKVRKYCKNGCIACKICEKVCPVDAIHVINGVARVDYAKCIDCGACKVKCPTKIIAHKPKNILMNNVERN